MCWLALSIAVAVWLWPIGIGGKMPVGGDVTQFSIGLMAVLREALRAGRLPLWNDLWGYGFPGVAESQMGVFYPPHVVLYGLLPTEAAYTASLVLHTTWGAWGTYWAARRFEISPRGSALAGFVWSATGFFVVHLPHQWGYTTGSWMPWAWGLGWLVLRGEGTRGTPFRLAAVLTMQVLPGHFQLAFITQVCLVLMAIWGLVEDLRDDPARRESRPPEERILRRGRRALRGPVALALALIAVLPLAAAQLWPTFRLARQAASRRDYEYLSGFAATPLHLISYVAPGLFHRSPLWRPLAWDPFHTSPEEHLAYVGLVPLFLAIGAIAYRFRRDAAVRLLVLLAVATLILSLGPYVPGFRFWCRLPGFSFFRSPSRWGLATSLALALLAGRGYDALPRRPRPGRSLARFVVAAALAPLLVVGLFELALRSTERPGWPLVARGFERAVGALPWENDPEFRELAALARRRQTDLRVEQGLAREGFPPPTDDGLRFSRARGLIYRRELRTTAALLVALLAVAPFLHRPRIGVLLLLVLTVVDLWVLGRHRAIDLAPIRPLTSQSPVLGRLSEHTRGIRTVDSLRNLPMVAGAAPISAYRTLDLPALSSLTLLAQEPLGNPDRDSFILAALRATGTGVRVGDPLVSGTLPSGTRSAWARRETIHDPALASWLYGAPWVARKDPEASTFRLDDLAGPSVRAWLVSRTSARARSILESWSGNPADVLELFGHSTPLEARSPTPERRVVPVSLDGPTSAVVIVSQLADPQWRATWSQGQDTRVAEIQAVFTRPGQSGWQAIRVPGPGPWTLQLEYSGRDVYEGLALSTAAWLVWITAVWRWARKSTSSKGEPT